ncbi:hypothetical protein Anapl_04169 [Anas platyrhynchos]|uniref:Uncharacterized protein n=1 Tax=Anas platyrhynchos TaxID=8839 RepID=R0LSW3_ANAPL|nr:hypothetical protein Anapl_04169 [Anas platyrhynchos]
MTQTKVKYLPRMTTPSYREDTPQYYTSLKAFIITEDIVKQGIRSYSNFYELENAQHELFSSFPHSLAHNHSSAQKASMERGTSKPLQAQHMLVLTNKACELGPEDRIKSTDYYYKCNSKEPENSENQVSHKVLEPHRVTNPPRKYLRPYQCHVGEPLPFLSFSTPYLPEVARSKNTDSNNASKQFVMLLQTSKRENVHLRDSCQSETPLLFKELNFGAQLSPVLGAQTIAGRAHPQAVAQHMGWEKRKQKESLQQKCGHTSSSQL